MPKITYLRNLTLLLFILFIYQNRVQGQVVIGAPSLGFTQACAGPTFNTYNTTFVFSPENGVDPTNIFEIELSDANGDFDNAVIVAASNPGEFATSPVNMSFSLPTNTAGEGYKIRIKSSSPAATSSRSVAFAAYYKIQDSPFTINNLVSTGAFCTGGSYLLAIDNPGGLDNDSPLQYENLTYKWYRETGPTTSVFVADGNTLDVSTEGTYFVETNYGTCTSNSFSNRVTVSEAVAGEANASISSSLGNPYCSDQGFTTLSTIGGLSYQWFKDGNAIQDETSQFYQTNESGVFSVQVDLGDCQASGSIDLMSQGFSASIDVPKVNEIEEGESLTVFVETDAANPVFEWYLNGAIISDESTNSLTATEFGNYEISISQTAGCEVSRIFQFEIKETIDLFPDIDNIPNIISPNGDGINDTWIIPSQYVTGTGTNITIFTSRGEIVLETDDYQNNWPIEALELSSINQIFYYIISSQDGEEKKGSITVLK